MDDREFPPTLSGGRAGILAALRRSMSAAIVLGAIGGSPAAGQSAHQPADQARAASTAAAARPGNALAKWGEVLSMTDLSEETASRSAGSEPETLADYQTQQKALVELRTAQRRGAQVQQAMELVRTIVLNQRSH